MNTPNHPYRVHNAPIYRDERDGKIKAVIFMQLDESAVNFYAAELPQNDEETADWSRLLERMRAEEEKA